MKRLAVIFCAVFVTAGIMLPAQSAAAFSLFPSQVCNAKNQSGQTSSVCVKPKDNSNPVAKLLGSVADIIAMIAGAVAVIIIIIAGFQFISSGGNSEQVGKARSRILGAIIGLLIIALAWTIIRLVIDQVIE